MLLVQWISGWHKKQRHRHRSHHHHHGGVIVYLAVTVHGPRHSLQHEWERHHHPVTAYYRIFPNEELDIMTDVTVGHTVTDTILFLDQHGNPMLTPTVPDSPPTWTNVAAPTVDTMSVSADGSTDTVTAVGAGVDTVTVTVVVGGVTFTAVQQLTVNPEAQVLTSVAINGVVS